METLLKDEYGDFAACYEKSSYQALRLNPLKREKKELMELFCGSGGAAPFFHLRRVEWEELGFYYEEEDQPGKSPYHEAGVFYIQEPSAQLPVNLMDIDDSGLKVLDLCAAPGGKSSQIAAKMNGKGTLICNEIHPKRALILSENMERMAVRNAIVLNEAPAKLSERFMGYFDRILVDAPCSGEGMFRKSMTARQEWSLENVKGCAKRQEEILEHADRMLKEGGRLVYSTCTFSREEDEETAEGFLGRHRGYELIECRKLYPHKHEGEGHFAAVFEKKGSAEHTGGKGTKPGLERPLPLKEASDFSSFARENLKDKGTALYGSLAGDEGILIKFGDNLYLAPGGTPSLKGLKTLRPGLHLGMSRKGRFEPSHALALALKPEDAVRSSDFSLYIKDEGDKPAIDKEGAGIISDYLSGLSFKHDGENGWYLISVDGFSLGWGKLSAGTMKNHYPKGLRKTGL